MWEWHGWQMARGPNSPPCVSSGPQTRLSPRSVPRARAGLNPIRGMDKPDTRVGIYIHLLNLFLRGREEDWEDEAERQIDLHESRGTGKILIRIQWRLLPSLKQIKVLSFLPCPPLQQRGCCECRPAIRANFLTADSPQRWSVLNCMPDGEYSAAPCWDHCW